MMTYVFEYVPHLWFLWPLAAAVFIVAIGGLALSGRRLLVFSGIAAILAAAGSLATLFEPGDKTFSTYILPIAVTSLTAVAATAGSSVPLRRAWKWVRLLAPLLLGLALVLASPIVMLYAACAAGNCI